VTSVAEARTPCLEHGRDAGICAWHPHQRLRCEGGHPELRRTRLVAVDEFTPISPTRCSGIPIDAYRDKFGVEPICRVLTAADCKIAPSTYHASKTRPASASAVSDAVMMQVLMVLWVTNRKVYALTNFGRPPGVAGMTLAATRPHG